MKSIFNYFEFLHLTKKNYNKYGFWGIILMLISVVSVLVGLIVSFTFLKKINEFYQLVKVGDEIDIQSTSMIGDFFGGVVGTIWSFAGVLLFFLALRLQSKELGLQIRELKDTREVFTTQQFENTFFNLIKTQNDIKQSIEIQEDKPSSHLMANETITLKSYMVFEKIKSFMISEKKRLKSNITAVKKTLDSDKPETEKESILKKFHDFYGLTFEELSENDFKHSKVIYKLSYDKYHNQLGHYFRNLYHILNYLSENEKTEIGQLEHEIILGLRDEILINEKSIEKEKIKKKYKKYSEFIQAQMNGDELFLLFHNGLFFDKMKKILHHYDFLENLSSDDLLNPIEDIKFYNECYIDGEKMQEIKFKSRNQFLKI